MSEVSSLPMIDYQVQKCMTHAESLHQSSKTSVEIQLHEIFLVALSNAIIDPWTVMVTLEYADITLSAMVSTLWFPSFLSNTFVAVFYLLHHVFTWKWCLHSFNDTTWICSDTAYVCYHLNEVQSILNNEEYISFVCQRNS